jgi:hypothetical protein
MMIVMFYKKNWPLLGAVFFLPFSFCKREWRLAEVADLKKI